MSDLTLIIIAGVFIYLFWGPHNKSKEKKGDKKDEKKGEGKK